jgi:hypothetical protein
MADQPKPPKENKKQGQTTNAHIFFLFEKIEVMERFSMKSPHGLFHRQVNPNDPQLYQGERCV